MDAYELIEKWKLNRALLASKMGMPKGTFNNKLSPNHPTQFKPGEKIKLRDLLLEISKELSEVDPIDFNEALKGLV